MVSYILEASAIIILYLLVMVVMAYEVFDCKVVTDQGAGYYVICDIGDYHSMIDIPLGKELSVQSLEDLR